MDYNDSISTMLNGKLILDINRMFSVRLWRYYLTVYFPLQLQVRHTKSYFPTLNFYSVNHWWQKPISLIYIDPVIEQLENSNRYGNEQSSKTH